MESVYSNYRMGTILLSGGTGIIGRNLCEKLKKKGYEVALLSRTATRHFYDIPVYNWDPDKNEIDQEALLKSDYIIHLAGTGIGEKRWTKKREQQIIDSRVKSGQLIFEKIKERNIKIKAFISASAIGYYGTVTSDKLFRETDLPSKDFLGETCRQWEKSADRFEELGIRVVKIRTGIVLTKKGGALSKMIIPVRMGIGSGMGKGSQYMPWIHLDDLCNIYIKAIEDTKMNGAYNAVAPDHRTNIDFNRILAHVLKKPFWFPGIPAIVMKIFFGKMSAILLYGSRVSSDKIMEAGYNFLFPDLENALADLLKENYL